MKWNEIFAPMNLSVRPQQATLGTAIIDTFSGGGPLIAEAGTGTGKSFAALVPMISGILDGKKRKVSVRGVVSTETNTLLDQYVLKDLPTLESAYPGFSYAALKGRGNYLCLNALKSNSLGRHRDAFDLGVLHSKLNSNVRSLHHGERSDIEKFLRRPLTEDEWNGMRGSSKRCADFKCEPDRCFSAMARKRALDADLVVTNHSILRVDADMRSDSGEGFLGPVSYLVVDEAHTLEKVLIGGWTEDYSEKEINDIAAKMLAGVQKACTLTHSDSLDWITSNTIEIVRDYLKTLIAFYHRSMPDNGYNTWDKYEELVKIMMVNTSGDPELRKLMDEYEVVGPAALDTALANLVQIHDVLTEAIKSSGSSGSKKDARDVRRAYSAASKIADFCVIMQSAMSAKDGIVDNYGVPTVASLQGKTRYDGSITGILNIIPLDISEKASTIWSGRKCVLMSATLQDMSTGGFTYLKKSLGFPESSELVVDAPFKYSDVQRIYLTKGDREPVDVRQARFSLEELVELLISAKGRSLVLFTANAELEFAYEELLKRDLPFRILAQRGDAQKRDLTREFDSDESSVLLATRSFFVGNSFEGKTLSQVVLVKYPLPRFDPVTRARSQWWRRRGFPKWYDEQSMTDFRQAAGRLIRSTECRGVVSIIDNRVANPRERVYSMCMQSIATLKSPIISTIAEVGEFIG